ncbi:MAG TPA: type II secretion system F family protein, partial [Mycobacterium sp.]|nr:type II secretion system F family protein [Mycobacterium sp.]
MSAAALVLALAVMLCGRTATARLRRWSGPPLVGLASGRNRVDVGDPFAAASALDVFATCLSAGMGVAAAARATAPSAPAELAGMLRRAADLLALGAEPA